MSSLQISDIIEEYEEPRVFKQAQFPVLDTTTTFLIIGGAIAAVIAAGVIYVLTQPPPSTTTPLSASISATPTSGLAPLSVNFASQVSGGVPPYSYDWAFGDGSTSTEANPEHTYQSQNTYRPSLSVTDSQGNEQQASATVTVNAPTTTPQTVNFSVEASDPDDPYLRVWALSVDGTQIKSEDHSSGDTMTATSSLVPGSHTLSIAISQDGGPSYGTYSGTAIINGQSHPFSGVYAGNPASISFTV